MPGVFWIPSQQPSSTDASPHDSLIHHGVDWRQTCSPYYIHQVAYYSDYVEVSPVRAITSTAVITFGKVQFSQHGISDALVTDRILWVGNLLSLLNSGSPSMLSYHHIAPNPKKKAQSAVKVVENLFEKALKNNKDCGWFCWTNEIRPQPAYSQVLSSGWCQEGKKRLSLRFLYHEMPQGVSESRKHDSDFKVGRPVLGHREVRTEAFWWLLSSREDLWHNHQAMKAAQEPFHVPEESNPESTERKASSETSATPITRFMASAPAARSSSILGRSRDDCNFRNMTPAWNVRFVSRTESRLVFFLFYHRLRVAFLSVVFVFSF